MEAKEALYRWSKYKNETEKLFLAKWLEDGNVDIWVLCFICSEIKVFILNEK